jgi:K+-transporting ATPase KdpF subunit
MVATLLLVTVKSPGMNFTHGYVIGAIIALLILGYLLYSLIKPEKF